MGQLLGCMVINLAVVEPNFSLVLLIWIFTNSK